MIKALFVFFPASVLLALAALCLFNQKTVYWLSHFKPLQPLTSNILDNLESQKDIKASHTLTERLNLSITVPRNMSVSELLQNYNIDQLSIRKQISLARTGKASTENFSLNKGEKLTIQLVESTKSSGL